MTLNKFRNKRIYW